MSKRTDRPDELGSADLLGQAHMQIGVPTSSAVIDRRSRGRIVSTRPLANQPLEDRALARRCWAASTISARMIVVGAVGSALLVAVDPVIPFASAAAVAMLVPAALVDVHLHRLPDVWVGAAAVVFLASIGSAWIVGQNASDATGIVVGTLVMSTPLLALHVLSPTSMGFGDVKAAVVLGAAVGAVDWQLTLAALALAAGSTATAGLLRDVRHIAFGPGLVGACLVALWSHDLLVRT